MESEKTVLDRIAKMDQGVGFNLTSGVAIETQLGHLGENKLAAFRDLRRSLDFRQLSGEAADAAVSAFLGDLASARAE